MKFKEFIKTEGLDQNKHKSFIRVGWDGRQDEVDNLVSLNERLQELSMQNFEKFESCRAKIVNLEEMIESDKLLVAQAKKLQEQNEELIEENKKIHTALAAIANDLAEYTANLQQKDLEISKLKKQLKVK